MAAGGNGPPGGPFDPAELSFRGRLRYLAHLFKARWKQHHRELLPVLAPFIPRDAVVLDVGGHAGQFARLFARHAADGEIFSFEPGSYARSILTRACAPFPDITVVPRGLGAAAGEAVLTMPIKASGAYGFGLSHIGAAAAGSAARSEEVRITTVDAFVREHGLERVDFIKADIEGYELEMLRGAAETLDRHHPVLLLEVDGTLLERAGASVAALHAFLADHGYRDVRRLAPGASPHLEPCPEPCEGDLLCR